MAHATQVVLIDTAAEVTGTGMPVSEACALVGVARSTYYRITRRYAHYRPVAEPVPQAKRRQPAALTAEERTVIVEVLSSDEHTDQSVIEAYWSAFDAGKITCSQRTFYRVAKAHRLVGDRRLTVRRPASSRRVPAVAAATVRDLWSWDVTELRGPGQERYFLYLVIDVFSRFPVGWCIEHAQTTARALALFADAVSAHGTPSVLHADNGSIQRAHQLLDQLEQQGILASFSRPRVSDDNPFSESLFKTIKYDPSCPTRFDSIEHARDWTTVTLERYATGHHHSALGRHTPAQVHYGTAAAVQQQRQRQLDTYWAAHPERFNRRPMAPALPRATGINTHLLSQTA